MLDLRVVGGCCGTDDEHVAAMAGALASSDDTGSRADSVPATIGATSGGVLTR